MRLKYITEDQCQELLQFGTDSTLRKAYNNDHWPFELHYLKMPSGIEVLEEFELHPKASEDANNSIKIFELLKELTKVQANDKRLWVSLTHGILFSYTQKRWSTDASSSDAAIKRRFHFEGGGLETRMRNAVSRLWWAAKLTCDESLRDPYKYTKVLWSKQDLFQGIVERSFGTYPNVVRALLEIIDDNLHLTEDDIRNLYTGLNAAGGVKVLPVLSKDQIKAELLKVAEYGKFEIPNV